MESRPVANLKQITITFVVDPNTLSEDAREDNLEGFHALLDNLIHDGLEHAEPNGQFGNFRIIMTDKDPEDVVIDFAAQQMARTIKEGK
jgi:hypothetical protein